MKHLLRTFLLLAIISPTYAYDFQVGELYYNITSNTEPYTAEVSSKLSTYPYNDGVTPAIIIIPETVTYNDITYEVTSIGDQAFFGSSSLTSITITNSITNIGSGAFYGSSSLTSITLPNSLTSIGSSAFSGCSSLMSITIPSGVTSIGSSAFSNCSSLSTIVWNAKKCDDFHNSIDAPFDDSVTSIIFGDSVEHIPSHLCYRTLITSISLPESIRSVGYGAFYRCSKLISVTIPDGITSIDGWAFRECTSLTSINIPESIINIGAGAFYKTAIYNNESNWVDGVLYIDNCLIEAKKDIINEYSVKEDTRLIAPLAFYLCKSLTSITIPENVIHIGTDAFLDCSSLSLVKWNARNCMDFEKYNVPFSNTIITSFLFGDNVKHIPEYICYRMNNLTSVAIPNNVLSVGKNAFSECPSIESITLTAPTMDIFLEGKGNRLLAIDSYYCPRKLVINGVEISDIVIPDGVTCIDTMSFFLCTSLTSIKIPSTVRSIEFDAFYSCSSLTTINLPEGVKSIRSYAFSSCSSLSSVIIPSSMEEIGDEAFRHCKSLDTICCHAMIPPIVKKSTFEDWNEGTRYEAMLYVPCKSLTDYQAHEIWGQFKNIQCISSEGTSVDNVNSIDKKPNKFLHNGQLLIFSDDKTYTIIGQEIR